MNTLPTIIRQTMDEQGLTYRDVAAAATRRGHQITHSRVHGYATGTTRSYKQDALKAIAAGLGVPSSRLMDAANMPRDMEPFDLPEDAVILTPDEREAIRGVVRTMIETRKQVIGNAEHPTPNKQAAGSAATDNEQDDYDLAASYGEEGVAPDELPDST